MKKHRIKLIALICVLVLINVTIVFATNTADKFGYDYEGNIKGYVSSLIVESGWGMHRGRSYVALMGSDAEGLSKAYDATSTIGYLSLLGRLSVFDDVVHTSEECTKHWYFSSVKTTLETDKDDISVKVQDN